MAGYIGDHYCLMLDRGEVHIVVAVILFSITIEVYQRSGSYCCGCYIVLNYCLRFDREVACIVQAGYIVDHYCLRFDREVVCIVVASYIVDHYCLIFNRGVLHIVVALILLNITV